MKKISIFGKSTVDEFSFDYHLIRELSYQLVKNNYSCCHGGYAGGIMQAAADGAHQACLDFCKDQKIHNIGVPEERFDKEWPRVPNSFFTDTAIDIYDRLRTITSSDVFIVSSKGGDGTLLEVDIVIHENTINEYLGKSTKPMIFLEGKDKKWSKLFSARLQHLDISKKDRKDYPWCIFIDISHKQISKSVKEVFEKINQAAQAI